VAEGKLGNILKNWQAPEAPSFKELSGRYVKLVRLSAADHAAHLFRSYDGHDHVWDYMPYGPFNSSAQYFRFVSELASQSDPYFVAIQNIQTGQYLGVQSYLRIDPNAGSIELGHICISPAAQRTPVSTEAFFLMMQWAFENGYRRFEWKCNALNMPSRRAAQRLGLSYEGIFRQATVVKGRNRDTAWFAAIDGEWPVLNEAFNAWLSPTNFDTNGQQKESLRNLTSLVLAQSDPMQDR
jgi:RimJ/RimL family protein N-acetyltransferase